jgi:hypothetical protein
MSGIGEGDGPPRRRRRRFSRREFLALGAAGTSVLAFGGVAFGQQQGRTTGVAQADEEEYKGHKIAVKKKKGREEPYVDDMHIDIIRTNGAYRADGYVFDPQPTIKDLAKAMVDAHEELKAKGVEDPGIL